MNILFSRFSFLVILLIILFNSTSISNANAACSISNVTFSEVTGIIGNFEENFTNLKITTNDCSDGIKVQLKGINQSGQPENTRIDSIPAVFFPDPNTNEVHMKLKTDEAPCYSNNDEDDAGPNWGHECVVYTEISNSNNEIIYNGNNPALVPSEVKEVDTSSEREVYRNRGVLLGDCSGACGSGLQNEDDVDNWDYVQLYENGGSTPDSSACQLSNNGVNPDVYFDVVPGPTITDRQVKLNIKTEGKCDSIPLKIQLWEDDGAISDNTIDIQNSPNGDYLDIIAPNGEDLYVTYKANEDDCEGDDDEGDWDCELYVEISKNGNTNIFSSESYITGNLNSPDFLQNINFKKGVIASECLENGDCRNLTGNNDWRFLNTNGDFASGNDPATIPTIPPTYDTTSPCYQSNANSTGEAGYDDDCYELLAPIPGLQSLNNSGTSNIITQEDGSIAIAKLSEFKLGDYINSMFQIALGILMVLSVIMIVVGGVQYMTTEAIFQKEAAKEYITKAVLGLILGLGIFIILNTINPRLLNINFGEGVDSVSIATVVAEQDISSTVILDNLAREQVNDYIFNSGVTCSGSGGQNAIPSIARSFVNKTTYRLGGKYYNLGNAQPNYAGNDVGNSCDISSNTLCLDCSGFTNLVLQCAGIIDLHVGNNMGTSGSFNLSLGAQNINSINLEDNEINNLELEIGDLIGYTGSTFGHIWIYIGNGEVAESTSGSNGRNLNNMVRIKKMTEIKDFDTKVNKIHRFSSYSN